MSKRKFKSPRKHTNQILTGLLFCGKCGQPYVIGDYYRGKYPYYRCSTKMKQGKAACSSRNLRGDTLDDAILKATTGQIFSKANLEKYKVLIDESIKDEKKHLQALANRLAKEQKELDQKKTIYYQGLESGKLNMGLVAERLEELKQQEEQTIKQRLEAEDRLFRLPDTQQYHLSKKEYANLKQSLATFVAEAPARQKHQFLSCFIKAITVHPDKLTIQYHPPVFTKKKSPGTTKNSGRGLSVIRLASPTGFEPVSPA
ncbi:MAG: hypothetical protein C4575_07300 [Desulforudis sp.]|nr:MAG: hypothetical protein C4575_07300 [Desulforudis sp.]